MKLSKKPKITIVFLVAIVIISTFLGIGYAQISAVDLTIRGQATLKKQDGIIITDVVNYACNNADYNLSKINDYYQTTLDSTIVLNNDSASTISYQVNIKNNYNEEYFFEGVVYDPTFYDNLNITYEITGINIGDKILPNEVKTIIITFKYNGTNTLNNTLNAYLNFKFVKSKVAIVEFETNNDTLIAPLTITAGTPIGNLPIPLTCSNQEQVCPSQKKFEGWYLEPAYETPITADYIVDNNVTIYAKWSN